MKPFYQDNHNRVFNKDCRQMSELSAESVQCVVTSPPYWGLRKYAGDQELEGWGCAYGLELTPELYVQHTIEILREIRRVLRKDGVVFWNIGDSYVSSASGSLPADSWQRPSRSAAMKRPSKLAKGLKPKDLCLIPFRVAIAAQEDGWWVRSVIIWSKLNPMPESVKDRPTESHEYILLLTKSSRYYWDMEAVREPYTEPMNRWGGETLKRDTSKTAEYKEMQKIGYSSAFRVGRPMRPDPSGRNIRSVWEFPTKPYPGAHFAVFPDKLPELCIKAATPEVGCCSECGAPWERLISKGEYKKHESERQSKAVRGNTADQSKHAPPIETKTVGWQPTCKCDAPRVPSIVLDPLMGAGTTLLVAKNLNRHAVGYELSEEYCRLAVERMKQQVLL